jgi:hypothetical protein
LTIHPNLPFQASKRLADFGTLFDPRRPGGEESRAASVRRRNQAASVAAPTFSDRDSGQPERTPQAP